MFELYIPPATTPAPSLAPSCPGCRTMIPECLMPAQMLDARADDYEPPTPVCWLCAHLIVKHGATLATALEVMVGCRCAAAELYPPGVWSPRPVIVRAEPLPALPECDFVKTDSPDETPRSCGMSARDRSAAARAAASKTAAARIANALAREPETTETRGLVLAGHGAARFVGADEFSRSSRQR